MNDWVYFMTTRKRNRLIFHLPLCELTGWLTGISYLDHAWEIPSIRQLQYYVQLIVLNKRCMVFYHIGVVQLLWEEKNNMSWTKKAKVKRRVVGDTCQTECVLGHTTYSETKNLSLYKLQSAASSFQNCQSISKQVYQLMNSRGSCHELCNPLYFHHQLKQNSWVHIWNPHLVSVDLMRRFCPQVWQSWVTCHNNPSVCDDSNPCVRHTHTHAWQADMAGSQKNKHPRLISG